MGDRERHSIVTHVVADAIAHEVKQPLTSILANAEAGVMGLTQGIADQQELMQILTAIAQQTRAVADIVDSVRGMLRDDHHHRAPTNLNDVIRETAAMMAGTLRRQRVALAMDLHDALPAVEIDRVQIRQVLMNLCVNAVDAMDSVHERARTLLVRSSPIDDGHVLVAIEDSGIGIDPRIAGRMFEPFVTTKPQGTGIGLALCRSIVEAHGGRLSASTRVPAGATFEIRLPLHSSAGEEPVRISAERKDTWQPGNRIS